MLVRLLNVGLQRWSGIGLRVTQQTGSICVMNKAAIFLLEVHRDEINVTTAIIEFAKQALTLVEPAAKDQETFIVQRHLFMRPQPVSVSYIAQGDARTVKTAKKRVLLVTFREQRMSAQMRFNRAAYLVNIFAVSYQQEDTSVLKVFGRSLPRILIIDVPSGDGHNQYATLGRENLLD